MNVVRLAVASLAAALLFSACTVRQASTPGEYLPEDNPALRTAYFEPPSLLTGHPGLLKETQKDEVLMYVNEVRRLHGLRPVKYRPDGDAEAQAAALMVAANENQSHDPDESWKCFTPSGKSGCATGNLALLYTFDTAMRLPNPREFVDVWLKDSAVDDVGHRRWLLNPFLKYISFGRVDVARRNGRFVQTTTGAVLKVVFGEVQPDAGPKPVVAYPYGDYPARLYNPDLTMSASIVANVSDYWRNSDVDLSKASVEIRDTKTKRLVRVTDLAFDYLPYGLENCIRWKADVVEGRKYEVKVKNVRRDNGPAQDYAYTFRLREDM